MPEKEVSEIILNVTEVTKRVLTLTKHKLFLMRDMARLQKELQHTINGRRVCELRAENLADKKARLTKQLRLEQDRWMKYKNQSQVCF